MRKQEPQRGDPRLHLILLVLMMALSWALRLQGLDAKSIWSDEGLSVYRARQSVAFNLTNKIPIQDVVTKDTQPPLYFILLHGVRAVAGESEFSLRFLSLCFATLIIPMLYILGKHLASNEAGLFAAFLAAAAPTFLWYAQEIRMYTMLVFLSLLSTYCLLKLLGEAVGWRRSKVFWLFAYLASTGAMIYTHYSGFFLLAFHGVIVAAFIIRSRRWRMMALMGLAILAALPLIPFALQRLSMGAERDFSFVPLNIILLDLLNGFSVGISVNLSKTVVPTVLGTMIFALGVLAMKSDSLWGRRGKSFLLLGYLLIPIFILYGASYLKPMYMGVRHLLVVSPAYYLAAGAGLALIWERRRRWMALVVLAAMLGGNVYATNNYFSDETYTKDDLRAMFHYVRDHYRPGDVVVLNDAVLEKPLDYYAPGMEWTAEPHYGDPADERTIKALQELSDSYQRIWYISGPPSTFYDHDQIVAAWLEQHLFKADFRRFAGYTADVGVFCYLTNSPLEAPIAAPGEPSFTLPPVADAPLWLLEYQLPTDPVPSGDVLPITLDWWLAGPISADYKLSARLLGPDGSSWAQDDNVAFYFFPMTEWPIQHGIRQVHEILLPPGTPPGSYEVELLLYHPDTGDQLVIPSWRDGVATNKLDLGTVQVAPAIRPVDLRTLPPHAMDKARFVNVTLAAHTWVDRAYEPNDVLHFDAYWQLEEPVNQDHVLSLVLAPSASAGAVIPLGTAELPTASWPLRQLVRSQHNLTLPANLPPGTYSLRASLRPKGEEGEALPVKHKWWQPEQAAYALAEMSVRQPTTPTVTQGQGVEIEHRYDVRLGEEIAFLGYDLVDSSVQAGSELAVTLYWKCLQATQANYTVFTHVIDSQNVIWGQKDNMPGDGLQPTSAWRAGDVITDIYRIPIKADTSAGPYLLTVGMYDRETLVRLTPLDAQGNALPFDRIELQTIKVTR